MSAVKRRKPTTAALRLVLVERVAPWHESDGPDKDVYVVTELWQHKPGILSAMHSRALVCDPGDIEGHVRTLQRNADRVGWAAGMKITEIRDQHVRLRNLQGR